MMALRSWLRNAAGARHLPRCRFAVTGLSPHLSRVLQAPGGTTPERHRCEPLEQWHAAGCETAPRRLSEKSAVRATRVAGCLQSEARETSAICPRPGPG